MIRKLRIKKAEKYALVFIFALVIVDVTFEILRLVFTFVTAYGKYPTANTLWVVLDPLISVFICSLPCYRGVLALKWRRSKGEDPVVHACYDSARFKVDFNISDPA